MLSCCLWPCYVAILWGGYSPLMLSCCLWPCYVTIQWGGYSPLMLSCCLWPCYVAILWGVYSPLMLSCCLWPCYGAPFARKDLMNIFTTGFPRWKWHDWGIMTHKLLLSNAGKETDDTLTIEKRTEKEEKKSCWKTKLKIIIIPTFSSKMRKRKVALIWKETLVVGTKNLTTERLDKLDESGALVFCKENNKVFVKVGRNHGGESFRLALQVANTIQILRMPLFSHCSRPLRDIFQSSNSSFKACRADQRQLRKAKWRGRRLAILLFGDYEFLTKMFV